MEGENLTKCRACGSNESTIWDSDTGNAVCPSCGTVDDAQRLVSGGYYPTREQNAYSLDLFRPQGTANSYAVRIKGAEWHLQNHLREHRKLISNICTSLEFHGRDRAIHHFEAAMANGDYRWGRESKLVCAVAIAIAMVEEKKPEPIPRIAELIGESPSAILRQWTHVTSTLDLHIRPTSPLLLLAMLHAYLLETSSPPSTLPTCILNNLSSHTFSLSSVLSTAERIASFFSLTNSFALLPSAPTTCGIFLVAIETEQGHALSLSTASAFAECLGKRFGVKGSTVLSRRRSMMMIFSEWATLLPWASVPTFTADGRNLWTVNKMSAIIRCVSDVLQFRYELSNRRGIQHNEGNGSTSNSQLHPIVVDEEVSSEPPSRASPVDNTQPPLAPAPIWWTSLKSRKKPRGSDSAQRMITMLLQPTSAHKLPPLSPSDDPEDVQERLSRIELQVLYGADQHHNQNHQYLYHPLSRLQALTLQRGGADNISDDELFELGELEGYRNAEEDAVLLGASHPEWNTIAVETTRGNGDDDGTQGISENEGKQGEKVKGKGGVKRSKADSVPVQVSYSDDDDDDDEEEEEDGDEYKGEEDNSGEENMELDDDNDNGPVERRLRHSMQQRSRSRASPRKRNRIAGTTGTRTRKEGGGDVDGDGVDLDEDGGAGYGDGSGGQGDGGVDGGKDEGVDTDSRKFQLGKDAYLAFGIFPGWEGDDPDTVRYFDENMEEM